MRRLSVICAVLASACSRSAPPAPAAAPLQPQKCAPRAYHEPDPPLCLVLPRGYARVRREKDPAFDRVTLGYDYDTEHPVEITLHVQWFPNGRSPEKREADYQEQLAALAKDPGGALEVLSQAPTADGNGQYLRARRKGESERPLIARSLVRSEHYRIVCEVEAPEDARAAVLDACRTLSPPP